MVYFAEIQYKGLLNAEMSMVLALHLGNILMSFVKKFTDMDLVFGTY